ncbi:MAG: Roadblock/LC7 domain protein [Methanocella sp. PtaU1.Bin125]|nr:MAG: Roadblock/LC7 domain protein [Methanocella sp. PtaU1.Bin125]
MQEFGGDLKAVLAKLKEAGVDSSAVIRRDGVIIEADLPGSPEEKESFAAMAAALLGAAETAASELRQGVPRRVIMEAGDRRIVELGAGPVALLVASLSAGPQFTRALKEIDRAAHEVRGIVKALQPA